VNDCKESCVRPHVFVSCCPALQLLSSVNVDAKCAVVCLSCLL